VGCLVILVALLIFGVGGSIISSMMNSAPHHARSSATHVTHHASLNQGSTNYAPLDVGIAIILAVVALVFILRNVAKTNNDRDEAAAQERSANVAQWLDQINRGALPEIQPDGIVPSPGERFFYEQRAQYGQTFSQRVYAGGNQALYVPLGHGFRARVGGSRGHAQTIANFMWVSYGTVYLSNLRVAFKADGSSEIAAAPYSQTLGYDTHEDGLAVQVERIGQMQFRTGDVILGALFQKIIKERSKPPSAGTTS
jgi:hypothetical protein